jgi:hypothetical protein
MSTRFPGNLTRGAKWTYGAALTMLWGFSPFPGITIPDLPSLQVNDDVYINVYKESTVNIFPVTLPLLSALTVEPE